MTSRKGASHCRDCPPSVRLWVSDLQLFVSNAWAPLQVALLGLLLGFLAAYAVAVLTSEIPVLRRAIMPLATVYQVTPVVAPAPGLVVALGFGLMHAQRNPSLGRPGTPSAQEAGGVSQGQVLPGQGADSGPFRRGRHASCRCTSPLSQ
jgi:hypothetical protein